MFYLSKTHRLLLMIVMVLCYFIVELIVGHVCDSVTLVADSFHMLSDVLALIVALGAVRVANKPRDGRHTYGFQRADTLGSLVNAVMLVTLCFTILVEAIQKIIEPHPMKDPKFVIYVGSGGLIINLIGLLLFCGHSHGHSHGNEDTHQAQLLMQQKSVELMAGMPQEAQPMINSLAAGDASASGAGDELAIVGDNQEGVAECVDAKSHAHSKHSPATTQTPAGASVITADQTAAAAASASTASISAPSPSILATVEHSVASLRRGSIGPSWLPSVLDEVADNEGGEGDQADDELEDGGGGGGGQGHGHSHQSGAMRASGHMNMQAAFLHIIGDTLGSVIVIISALTLWLAPPGYSLDLFEDKAVLIGNDTCIIVEPERRWQTYVDPSLSLLLVAIMLYSTFPLLHRAYSILMQSVPKEVKLDELQKKLENLDGVVEVHDLHVWQLQSNCYIGTVHIRCRDLPEYISVSRAAKTIFHNYDIHCTTIQPEFVEHTSPRTGGDRVLGDSLSNGPGCLIDCGTNKCVARSNCCAVKGGGLAAAAGGASAAAAGGDAPETV